MIIKVFGADNCSGCITVKNFLNKRNVEHTQFDVNNHEHMEEAMVNGVRSIPTVVVETGASVQKYVGAANCVAGLKHHLPEV